LINTKVNIQKTNNVKICLEKRGDLIYNIVNTRGGNVDVEHSGWECGCRYYLIPDRIIILLFVNTKVNIQKNMYHNI